MRLGLGLHITGLRAGGEAAPFALASFFSGAASSDAITHARAGNATMIDSDGLLKWAPHNLLLRSEEFDNAAWATSNLTVTPNASVAPDGTTTADKIEATADNAAIVQTISTTVSGVLFTHGVWVRSATGGPVAGSIQGLSSSATRTEFTATNVWQLVENSVAALGPPRFPSINITTSGDSLYVWGAHVFRSDLGGMVNNPDRGDSYVPTTSTAVYLPRRGHHIYDGAAWVNEGLLHESEARINLLHTTDALVTQSLSVTNTPHTLHFTGTGTVTLSGASTAGPLVGTGTGENNRVSLTFTPTAGSLTLTVSGTVTNAQLEEGSTLSSHIPNLAASGSVTRAAETLTIPAANLPWSPDAVSIQMQGTATGEAYTAARWYADANNYITQEINSSDFTFEQADGGTVDAVTGGTFSPGVNVPFNIASRHGSTFINGAIDGTALTANTTPVALPDLETTDLDLGFDYMGTIKQFRVWGRDIGDTGIAEETT